MPKITTVALDELSMVIINLTKDAYLSGAEEALNLAAEGATSPLGVTSEYLLAEWTAYARRHGMSVDDQGDPTP